MPYHRVLIADHHHQMLTGMYSLLDPLFDTVLMVADEASLHDVIESMKPDLIVVDISLHYEGESNIPQRLLDRYPEACFILISVHDEPIIVSQMLEMGVSGFVLKRTLATDLVPAVGEVLDGGIYVSPTIDERPLRLR